MDTVHFWFQFILVWTPKHSSQKKNISERLARCQLRTVKSEQYIYVPPIKKTKSR